MSFWLLVIEALKQIMGTDKQHYTSNLDKYKQFIDNTGLPLIFGKLTIFVPFHFCISLAFSPVFSSIRSLMITLLPNRATLASFWASLSYVDKCANYY